MLDGQAKSYRNAETMRTPDLLLTAEALSYEVSGVHVVKDLSLELPRGACTVMMGPNGAGKSVLLRLLHGLLRPSGGSIAWKGDAKNNDAQAMVFQRPVLLRRSVRANLNFALARRGRSAADQREQVAEMLAKANLSDLADRPARALSGGEQQRLAVARALIRQPQLLFLDEPTASLDPASTLAIEALIRGAIETGITVLLVTHDIGQAKRLGDHLIFMENGIVAETGTAAACLSSPKSAALSAWLQGRIRV